MVIPVHVSPHVLLVLAQWSPSQWGPRCGSDIKVQASPSPLHVLRIWHIPCGTLPLCSVDGLLSALEQKFHEERGFDGFVCCFVLWGSLYRMDNLSVGCYRYIPRLGWLEAQQYQAWESRDQTNFISNDAHSGMLPRTRLCAGERSRPPHQRPQRHPETSITTQTSTAECMLLGRRVGDGKPGQGYS